MAFIRKNFFQITITVLLTVLLGVGGYFVRKIEAHERRIHSQELIVVTNTESLKALKETIQTLNGDLGDQIAASENRVIEKVTRCEELIDLLLERGQ